MPVTLLKIANLINNNAELLELANANNQIAAAVTWSNNNAHAIKLTALSIKRLARLVETMRDEKIKPENKIEYHIHNETSLVLDNVRFEHNNKTILSIEHLEFERGKVYSITGKLGSGKSIVLKYGIFGIKHTGIQGSGDVTYPADKHLVCYTK